MKKIIGIVLPVLAFFVFLISVADAQMMLRGGFQLEQDSTWGEIVEHTKEEEAEGATLWEKLQSGELSCAALTAENFEALGEYFMGTMMDEGHASMNAMLIQMMGEDGEEAMHESMGRRLSGCDPDAVIPGSGIGFMPMMNMMGGWSGFGGFGPMSPLSSWMTSNWTGVGFFGGLLAILWWAVIIAGIVAVVKWVAHRGERQSGESPLEILGARYAKGEITKQEFDERKKDLQQ